MNVQQQEKRMPQIMSEEMEQDRLNEPVLGEILRGIGHAARRGVTLVEVLIVIAIMSLIATTVVVAVIPKFQQAMNDTALNSAREIRSAVVRWRATRGGDQCPTVSQLVSDKEIDTASKIDDPWGSQFKIICSEDEVVVASIGRDKKEGTPDDLSVPAKAVTH
jgi:general secretion pathway protein G